ncbi:MAG TPA: helix-turn-helix domain-containing protein [Solirubrobacteraceae bacterium]|nr:helix-turn-helix domain-containing protein [Solirubrobacteraceae bacterium]
MATPPALRRLPPPVEAPSQACERTCRETPGAEGGSGPGEPAAAPVAPERVLTTRAVEPWVDGASVAAHLACTEQHVYDLAKRSDSRRIPHRREGRRLLFKLSKVDRWLECTGAR